jgi:DNA primase
MTRIDWADLRARHPLREVVRRSGIDLPADTGDVTVCYPVPGHDETIPSMVIHLNTDRYYCFGCGAHGDVIQWIRDVYRVNAVEAARILDGDRPSAMRRSPHRVQSDQATTVPTASPVRPERPALDRTPADRVQATLDAAWDYYTLPALHRLGLNYLKERNIDIVTIETEKGDAIVGHTPARADGLTAHLRQHGFSADEVVDASLGRRYPDGRCIDFFRQRAVLPVHNDSGQLAGFIGRATVSGAVPKYLNMSRTHTYDKSIALYRPSRPALDRHANVVVCEGPLDALAIAAQAATSGFTNRYAPVALCGVALTDNQLHRILAIHPLPPILTGDGDPPGRKAAVEWATRAALAGRESVVTIWPDGHDPASWIAEHGEHGLVALTRKGCLEPTNTDLRPHHAGEIIALTAVAEAVAGCIPLDRARYMALAPLNHLQGGAASRYLDAVGKACASAFDSDEILVACMRSPTVKNGTSVGGQPIAEAVEL